MFYSRMNSSSSNQQKARFIIKHVFRSPCPVFIPQCASLWHARNWSGPEKFINIYHGIICWTQYQYNLSTSHILHLTSYISHLSTSHISYLISVSNVFPARSLWLSQHTRGLIGISLFISSFSISPRPRLIHVHLINKLNVRLASGNCSGKDVLI